MPTARKLTTNTVHSVGTLSITTAGRAPSCPLSSKPARPWPASIVHGQDAAQPLNGLSTPPWKQRRGFELMNGETTDAEIRHIFAALWPRASGARLVKTTAK